MKNFIILLSVNERIIVPDESDPDRTATVVTQLLEMAKLGQVTYNSGRYHNKYNKYSTTKKTKS